MDFASLAVLSGLSDHDPYQAEGLAAVEWVGHED